LFLAGTFYEWRGPYMYACKSHVSSRKSQVSSLNLKSQYRTIGYNTFTGTMYM